MLERSREFWSAAGLEKFVNPVEADETYMSGKRKNMSNLKRSQLTGRRTKPLLPASETMKQTKSFERSSTQLEWCRSDSIIKSKIDNENVEYP